ncbi:MAG: methylmalonyl Co-A mutase-associated GTPase MeaB [Myxococcota bacterium]|nr:methylmalonyl Co-A mutase-associated GTPase MeaB [Myxococcota bacterium]
MATRPKMTIDDFYNGIIQGERAILAQAITLMESKKPSDRPLAEALLARILPHTGNSIRVGLSGIPGSGKSTLIESLGNHIVSSGKKLAVLAVDPSSTLSGGSILGDKTRMETLSTQNNAFIRPSPTAGSLGGVAARTREAMLCCEAAGYNIVIIETVGVGQSEVLVADMTDIFIVLTVAGTGDDLQGIKRGLMELANLVLVNKADGNNQTRSEQTARSLKSLFHIIRPGNGLPVPKVITCSALQNSGIQTIWTGIQGYIDGQKSSAQFANSRKEQQVRWFWAALEDTLKNRLLHTPTYANSLKEFENGVRNNTLAPTAAATKLIDELFKR